MQKIDPAEFQQRLDRLADIFGQMVQHAQVQSRQRCPYKNKDTRCTALFGCRYQQASADDLPICNSNDALDYRSAWETDGADPQRMRHQLDPRQRRQDSGSVGSA